jgi:hypothetical protein
MDLRARIMLNLCTKVGFHLFISKGMAESEIILFFWNEVNQLLHWQADQDVQLGDTIC